MNRLFVALLIPKDIKAQITKLRKNIVPDAQNLRWENESKIHLTLKFIGEVKENLVGQIKNELDFLESYHRLNCKADKFGFFFDAKKAPRILWIGLKVDNIINSIVDELNQHLARYSIPVEKRKFKAHITLLRIKQNISEEFIKKFKNAEFPEINFTANEIALMQSKLSTQGSDYTEIKKYNLK